MKQRWEKVRLGEIVNLEYGKPLPRIERKIDGLYPVYGANGQKKRTDKYYCSKKSVIVGRKGSAGEVNLTEEKFWPLDVTYFTTFDNTKHDLKFLFFLLKSLNLPKLAKGVKPGINRNEVYSLIVKIPPLPEQRRIVAILDEAFAAIDKAKENTQKNLQNAHELFETYLNNVFENSKKNWEKKKLGDVLCKTETINPSLNPDKEFNYIDVSSVDNKQFIINETKLIKGKKAPSRARKLIREGDIIFATVRPTLKRIAVIPKELDNQVCSTGFFVMRTNGELINLLIFYYLLSARFLSSMEEMQKGASYPAVTDNEVRGQEIAYPKSLIEQHEIVSNLKSFYLEINKLESIYRQKLTDLDELKQSLLRKAFKGEL